MKKITALMSLVLMAAALPALADESPVGTVTGVTGDVTVVRRGSFIPVVKDMEIRKDDLIRAAAGGTADVSLNNLAGCRVLGSTECAVEETAKENMRFNVTTGNVILNLQKLPSDSKFRIETPTAVASVRGTQFWGRVDP